MLMGEPLAATLLVGGSPARSGRRARPSRRAGPVVGQGGLRAVHGLSSTPCPAPPARRWLLPGVLFGALALVRPEYLGVALLVSLVVLLRHGWRGRIANVRASRC